MTKEGQSEELREMELELGIVLVRIYPVGGGHKCKWLWNVLFYALYLFIILPAVR